jgi:hypothetical protein
MISVRHCDCQLMELYAALCCRAAVSQTDKEQPLQRIIVRIYGMFLLYFEITRKTVVLRDQTYRTAICIRVLRYLPAYRCLYAYW